MSENVEGLLLAVKATNDFESDMAQRFGGGQEASMTDVRNPCSWHVLRAFICMYHSHDILCSRTKFCTCMLAYVLCMCIIHVCTCVAAHMLYTSLFMYHTLHTPCIILGG